jgi:choline dehydrogenase-like flavoprotein
VIATWRDHPRGVHDDCDVVVIGTGAAGGAIGKVLTDAGLDVVFLEEGPPIDHERAGRSVAEAARHLFRESGTQVATGRSVIPVLQGRCVGGSTAINSAICWRIPDDAYDRAFARFGLTDAVPLAELHRHYDQIEKDLEVEPVREAAMGRNNLLMKQGAEALGYQGQPTRRYEQGCEGSGRCIQSCASQRKRSVDVTYIPHAVERGARVYATCRAQAFVTSGKTVTGVKGRFFNPDTGEPAGAATVLARRGVVLAASVVQTPALLATLHLDGRAHLGQHFRAHPGTGMAGLYDEPVRPWLGATQGYEVTHFRDAGIKLESLCIGPELGSVRMAGVGQAFMDTLADFDHMAVWVVAARADAEGSVRGAAGGGAAISYTPSANDMFKVRSGMRALAAMHFAAGARCVLPGIHGVQARLGRDQLGQLAAAPLDPQAYSLVATHLFGTARMATDPADGVVGTGFEVHGVRGLYVVDSSLFPTNIGVNPQHTIMAVAMIAGERIANAAPTASS